MSTETPVYMKKIEERWAHCDAHRIKSLKQQFQFSCNRFEQELSEWANNCLLPESLHYQERIWLLKGFLDDFRLKFDDFFNEWRKGHKISKEDENTLNELRHDSYNNLYKKYAGKMQEDLEKAQQEQEEERQRSVFFS